MTNRSFSLKADKAENKHIAALEIFETLSQCHHLKNASAIRAYFGCSMKIVIKNGWKVSSLSVEIQF